MGPLPNLICQVLSLQCWAFPVNSGTIRRGLSDVTQFTPVIMLGATHSPLSVNSPLNVLYLSPGRTTGRLDPFGWDCS